MLPTFAVDCGPFGTHLSAELSADERAGLAVLPEQHGDAFATAPGNLTTATECCIPLRAGAVPAGCRAPRYSAEKREGVAEQYQIALDAGVIERVDHNPSEWCSPALCVKKKASAALFSGACAWTVESSTRVRYRTATRCRRATDSSTT